MNESSITAFPSLGSGNTLEALYRKRKPGWTKLADDAGYSEKYEITPLTPPLRYYDPRHYEVFMTGTIMRDVEFESKNRGSKSFNP